MEIIVTLSRILCTPRYIYILWDVLTWLFAISLGGGCLQRD